MDPTKVATLKKKLLEAKDLTEIVEYFFEEFGNRASYQGYSFQVSGAVSF